jgi:hypothetical protein
MQRAIESNGRPSQATPVHCDNLTAGQQLDFCMGKMVHARRKACDEGCVCNKNTSPDSLYPSDCLYYLLWQVESIANDTGVKAVIGKLSPEGCTMTVNQLRATITEMGAEFSPTLSSTMNLLGRCIGMPKGNGNAPSGCFPNEIECARQLWRKRDNTDIIAGSFLKAHQFVQTWSAHETDVMNASCGSRR